MAETFESDFPNALETFADQELAVIHRMFDEAPDLQHDLGDYQALIPVLPSEDAALCGDAARQVEVAVIEDDLPTVTTMLGYIRQVLIDRKIIL